MSRLASDGTWTTYTTTHGLTDNRVNTIAIEPSGRMWFSGGGVANLRQATENTCQTAMALDPSSATSSDIDSATDHGFYKFDVPERFSRVEITVSDPQGQLDAYLYRSCDSIGSGQTLDLAEAWLGRGVAFIGSTGYAYGLDGTLAYQEVLMDDFTQRLVAGDGSAVGDALRKAKQDYYSHHEMNHFHAKTLAGTVLYGLPMYRVQLQGTHGQAVQTARPPAGVTPESVRSFIRPETTTKLMQVASDVISTTVVYHLDGQYELVSTPNGSYYTVRGQRPRAESDEPVQPKLTDLLVAIDRDNQSLDPRGVVFRQATYRELPGFTPLTERATSDVPGSASQSAFNAPGWYPRLPLSLRQFQRTPLTGTLLVGGNEAQLLVYAGQYNAALRTERLFKDVTLDEYYSASADRDAPTIQSIVVTPVGQTMALSVRARDASGVASAVVAYDYQGAWQSVDLTLDMSSGVWQGTLPSDVAYVLQVVDAAGNVAVDAQTYRLYLPLIIGANR